MAVYGVLAPGKGTLHYANAGHPLPRWWRAARGVVEPVPDVSGLPLGVDPEAVYLQGKIELEPGDIVVYYSDGLTEAGDRRGEMFGCRRLDSALQETAHRGAEGVKAGVLARLQDFLAGKRPHDDLTLFVLERLLPGAPRV